MIEEKARRRVTQEVIDSVQDEERDEIEVLGKVDRERLIPTGSTLLNLALSDDPYGGFVLGTMANIIGDSQAGKCVKNAYILSKSKGMSLIDDVLDSSQSKVTPHSDVIALDEKHTVKTSHFYKEKVGSTISIVTKDGYELEGTKNHPILIWNQNCSFSMKKLSDIKEGDVAVIAKGTNVFGKNAANLSLYSKGLVRNANAKEVFLPKKMSKEFALLLGYIVANGVLGKSPTSNYCYAGLSSRKEWFQKNVDTIIPSYNIKWNRNSLGDGALGGVIFARFLHNIFSCTSLTARKKFVPDCVLSSPKVIQASFLKGLIDADGWFNKRNQLHYYTASKKLALQVQLMLLNFGIESHKSVKNPVIIKDKVYNHDYYTISIYGMESLEIYKKEIGSDKYDFSCLSEIKGITKTIPYLKEKMIKDRDIVRQKIGWSRNGTTTESNRFPRMKMFCRTKGEITTQQIKKFIGLMNPYKKYFDLGIYEDLLKMNYHFDPIIKISSLNHPEKTWVYDYHIPKDHIFWSNGFISHNTFLLWSCFAEMAYDKRFDDYDLDYDEPESAFAFDIKSLFGEKVEERIHWYDESEVSETVEGFHDSIMAQLDTGNPFVRGLDSLDAIAPEDEYERDIRKGTFGASKPKLMSQIFRKIVGRLKNTNSMLFIISQTRDNIGVMFGDKKTRSGGKALKFFATHELWLAVKEHIKQKDRDVGTYVRVKISKNKITGKVRIVEFPIYVDYGIDDITSCIDFLMSEKFWTKGSAEKKKGTVKGSAVRQAKVEEKKERGLIDTRGAFGKDPIQFESLRLMIAQDPEKKKKLVEVTTEAWRKIEDSLKTNLPSKYPR